MKTLTSRLILFTLLLSSFISQAAYIRNYPVTVTQPNGQILNCFVTGDEYYNWLHDANNFTIVRNSQTAYYCYAILINDKLIASQYIAGVANPSSSGLQPGANISDQKILQIRNNFINATPNLKSGGSGPSKAVGTINNLVIFIRFAGESEFTDNISLFGNMFVNTPGTSSMKNYFEEVSYAQLHINSSYYPTPGVTVISYQDALTRDYYQPYDAVLNPNGYTDQASTEHTLLKNAINAVSSQIPGGLNLDYNSDGYVDNICFIVSGDVTAWSTLLWPHRWSLYSETVTINGKTVSDYNLQIRNHLVSNGVGVLCHEMFHTLGSPDLYHYNQDGLSPAGPWDIMDNNQNPPQSMGAYMKYRYGNWIASIPLISAPGTYTLNPITSSSGNCFRINSPNSSSEFFVVEYRKQSGVFESSLPGSGLLVYRINSVFDGMGNASYDGFSTLDEVYIYRPNGTIGVIGSVDIANFSANVNRKKINNNTNPSSFLSDGNIGTLDISNVTLAGNTISFDLNGGPAYPVNAGIESLVSPFSGCGLTANQAVTIEVKNFGTNPISSGLQLQYQINGGPIVSESYTGSAIPAGSTINYTFAQTGNFSNTGTYSVTTWTSIVSDGNHSNDTMIYSVTNGILSYTAANAQTFIDTYTDLGSNGSIISTANFDDANSAAVSIGFTFEYNCATFTQFILNTNGFIKLGNIPPSSSALFFTGAQNSDGGIFNSTNPADMNIISGFNHDLMAGTLTPQYRVYTSGIAPNRICTIQFKNLRDKTTTPLQQYNNISFQIKLFETTNQIEIIYGSWSASANASDFKTSAVGLKGPGSESGQLLVARKGSTQDWASIIFDNNNYFSTSTLNFGNPPDRPAPETGRALLFSPDLPPNLITSAATSVTGNSAVLNGFVNANGIQTTVGFEYGLNMSYGNFTVATPGIVSSSISEPVSAPISGLTPNVVYHFRVKATNSLGVFYGNDMTFVAMEQITETKIGTTTYDLQSNASVDNRLVVHPDGTISACWTYSSWLTDLTFPDRGTAYNYFDGNSWDPYPTARIESVKTGWPTLSSTSTNYDVMYSHDASLGLKQIKGLKGSGSWAVTQSTNTSPYLAWPRMKISGQKIHLFAITNPSTTYLGMKGALVYYRSLNGGSSWDQQMVILNGMTSANYVGFSGDSYAIDIKGDTVALVVGDDWYDVFLMKSNDGGTTWTKKMIWQFPLPLYDPTAAGTISDINSDGISDTIVTCDGNMAVILDNTGIAHVFFGEQKVEDSDPAAGGTTSYYPGNDGLLYWNENKAAGDLVTIASVFDADNSGTIDFAATPGYYYNSLSSMPNAGIDRDGHLYVTYSSFVENSNDGNGKAYRNIYYIKSANNGTTWSWPPVNLTPSAYSECVFGTLNKNVDGYLQMIYQRDDIPGMAVRGDLHAIGNNDIMYLKCIVTDGAISGSDSLCLGGSTGTLSIVGYTGTVVKWQKKINNGSWTDIINTNDTYIDIPASVGVWQYRAELSLNGTYYFSAPKSVHVDICTSVNRGSEQSVSIYPNPATQKLYIEVSNNTSKQRFEIFNVIGKSVYSSFIEQMAVVDVSQFQSGVYFVKLYSDKSVILKKFIKE